MKSVSELPLTLTKESCYWRYFQPVEQFLVQKGYSNVFGVIRELWRFLLLLLRTKDEPIQIVPSHVVEIAWNVFILNTKLYREFGREMEYWIDYELHVMCQHAAMINCYEKTLMCYRLVFGEHAPPAIWPRKRKREVDEKSPKQNKEVEESEMTAMKILANTFGYDDLF